MRFLNEELRKECVTKWQESILVRRESPKEEKKPDDLYDHALRMCEKADGEPAKPLCVMYRELNLSGEEGLRAKNELLSRGYCAERGMARKGSGAQIKVLEVLPRGQAELRIRGFLPHAKIVGRGRDWKHTIGYPTWIQRWCISKGYQVWFERKLASGQAEKIFDAIYSKSDGKLFGIEICLSGDWIYNSDAAEKAAGVHGIEIVFMAFEDIKLKEKVKSQIKEMSEYIRKKVMCVSLGEYAPQNIQ